MTLPRKSWPPIIQTALKSHHDVVTAVEYLERWPYRGSRPIRVLADDGCEYIVKSLQNDQDRGRAISIEHIAEHLGALIDGPVPHPQLVDIPRSLIERHPDLSYIAPGLGQGTEWLGECEDCRDPLDLEPIAENRSRYALIAILMGWIADWDVIGDIQFIYTNKVPQLVYAVDFDVFWEAIPLWDEIRQLHQQPDPILGTIWMPGPAEPHIRFARFVADELADVDSPELRNVCRRLLSVCPEDIACAVAAPPSEWGLHLDVRVELAIYLDQRRTDLIKWARLG